MPFSKAVSLALAVLLGVCLAVPVCALTESVVLAFSCGVTTFLLLDIILIQPFSPKGKLVFLVVYLVSILAVVFIIFSARS